MSTAALGVVRALSPAMDLDEDLGNGAATGMECTVEGHLIGLGNVGGTAQRLAVPPGAPPAGMRCPIDQGIGFASLTRVAVVSDLATLLSGSSEARIIMAVVAEIDNRRGKRYSRHDGFWFGRAAAEDGR